jgi:hypothetical protein
LDLVPIEAMVLVEARIFRGDDSVLKIGRLKGQDELTPIGKHTGLGD